MNAALLTKEEKKALKVAKNNNEIAVLHSHLNDEVIEILRNKESKSKSNDTKIIINAIITNDTSGIETINHNDVEDTLVFLRKEAYRVKRHFGNSISALHEYAVSHNCGISFDDENQFCCYEYFIKNQE